MSKHKLIPYDWSPLLAATLLACALATGCGPKKRSTALPPPKVVLGEVVKKAIPIQTDFSGTIQSIKTVEIIPRVSGYIDKVYFKDGTFAKKNDPLYLIDPKPFKARLDAAQANLKKDQTQYAFWKIEAERYTRLGKSGAVSKEQMESMQAKMKVYAANVQQDQADVENAKLQLGYTAINAPFDGRVQRTHFYEGDLVQEQRDTLTSVIQLDPIYVTFNVSREQLFSMQKLAIENKLFPTEKMVVKVFLPDGTPYKVNGKVNYMSYQIDPSTDSVLARGVITNKAASKGDFLLIPGQYAPVRVIIGEEPDALLVPATAVVESQIGTTVYVVDKNNKVSLRKVELGAPQKNLRQITKGLKEGERVIALGVQKVKEGVTVKPVDEDEYQGKKAGKGDQ